MIFVSLFEHEGNTQENSQARDKFLFVSGLTFGWWRRGELNPYPLAELESEVPVCKFNFRFGISLARLNSGELNCS